MCLNVRRDDHIFKFSRNNKPVLIINSGDTVNIETLDCFSNQIQKPEDNLESIDWERVNPAAGPIYINGARPGDVLKVTIEEIKVADQGVMASGKDLGVLGEKLNVLTAKLIKIQDDKATFSDKLYIPVEPMIGVIGVSPEKEEVNCGTPGSHGGNMDNRMIKEGATLYLPVFVEGALFALGDIHAAMGDGEIGVTGIEISASVRASFQVVKKLKINNPLLEDVKHIETIASAENLDEAVNVCVKDMTELFLSKTNMDMNEIAMLLSAVGSTQICQVVDPLKTARFAVPKWVFEAYGIYI